MTLRSAKRRRPPIQMLVCVSLLISFFLFPGADSSAKAAQTRKSARLSAAARARVRRAIEAVGLILVRNRADADTPRPRGSGVVVRGDGILVTNGHVITETGVNHVFDELYLALSASAA